MGLNFLNNNWNKTYLIPFILFCLLTIIMTYPLIFNMHNSLRCDGDTVFWMWNLSWEHHKLTSSLNGFWNANIFYPNDNTLAYSEHGIGLSLISLPVALIFKNPILSYNFVLFLSFIVPAFGTYLLVLYLTKNEYAGIISGIIFAFSHFNLLLLYPFIRWIPFCLLYLHKFFDTNSCKNLFLFGLFFILQALCSNQYTMWLAIFILIGMSCFLSSQNRYKNKWLWLKLIFIGMIFIILISPLALPYLRLKKEIGALRTSSDIEYYSADVLSYVLPNPNSILYGKFSPAIQKLGKIGSSTKTKPGEKTKWSYGALFPGLIAIFLTILSLKNIKKDTKYSYKNDLNKWILFLFNLLIILVMGLSIYIFAGKGLSVLGVPKGTYSLRKPILLIFVFLIIRLIIDRSGTLKLKNFLGNMNEPQRIYFLFVIFGFFFSLGTSIFIAGKNVWNWHTPYTFLYNFIPGFSKIRAAASEGIFTMLGVSIFAGYGVCKILNSRLNIANKKIIVSSLLIGIILENLCIPFKFANNSLKIFPEQEISWKYATPVFSFIRFPICNEFPPVYKWLAKEKGNFPIIELPMVDMPYYMYYSTYHWKKLVNGYSSFSPPGYTDIIKIISDFPSDKSIRLLEVLGIKYIILHKELYENQEWKTISNQLQSYGNKICMLKNFDNDLVYSLGIMDR